MKNKPVYNVYFGKNHKAFEYSGTSRNGSLSYWKVFNLATESHVATVYDPVLLKEMLEL